jgi:hypothetical protein
MSTASVDVYKNGIKLGSGTADTAASTITSYSGTAPNNGRNVQVVNLATPNLGASYNVQVLSGSGTATLTVTAPFPYTGT